MSDAVSIYCLDERRQAVVRRHPTLNGIEAVESFEDRSVAPARFWLVIHLLKAPPDATFYGLVGHPELFIIEGGARIVGIRATAVAAGAEPTQLEVDVSEEGDFSTYGLAIDSAALDPRLTNAPFRFRASCPSPFDCLSEIPCPPELLDEPVLDYLAKDYASFRQLMLDLIPQRNPTWLERNPADLGMVLVELLAYAGDRLSYFQDAVATESYLDTSRHRISARRHARLVDYRMHQGRNAWGYVVLTVDAPGSVPQGTPLATRIDGALRGQPAPPGVVVPAAMLDFDADPALSAVTTFETTALITADPLANEIEIYSWGNRRCCLPRGTTQVELFTVDPASGLAVRPPLVAGDYLLLEERLGPTTGLAGDADPENRQVVRLIAVEEIEDPLHCDQLDADRQPLPVTDAAQATLPLLRVTWDRDDGLGFPLCQSSENPETGPLVRVSLGFGNVAPVDHGRTVEEAVAAPNFDLGADSVTLARSPLTFQGGVAKDLAEGWLARDRHALAGTAGETKPAVELAIAFPPAELELWTPVPDLLESNDFDRQFVAEIDNDGRALLRFGDDQHGARPLGLEGISARYRIGNGARGNLGRESLVHIASPLDVTTWPGINAVRQPLPMRGGAEAETIEEVRQRAPTAFHAEQFRAVTEADYEAALLKLDRIAAVKASFRWTGSWLTVFVGVHPSDSADLLHSAGSRPLLRDALRAAVLQQLTRYRLAGYDLEVRAATYLPVEINVRLCVVPGHFRGDVLRAVQEALSNRILPDGRLGFFHPSNFSFGEPLYLSRLYLAIEQVPGVDSADATLFKRYWFPAGTELADGAIVPDGQEVIRCDNDANFPENGVLELTALDGL